MLTVYTVNHYVNQFFDDHFRRVYRDGAQTEVALRASRRHRFTIETYVIKEIYDFGRLYGKSLYNYVFDAYF